MVCKGFCDSLNGQVVLKCEAFFFFKITPDQLYRIMLTSLMVLSHSQRIKQKVILIFSSIRDAGIKRMFAK